MSPVHALDKYYLGITILVTIGYQMLGFFIAWTFQVRALATPFTVTMTSFPPNFVSLNFF